MILRKVYTLVFIRKDHQILLGYKKRGFGMDKYNGFGGKVEPNESIIDAAVRELREESCLEVKTSDLKSVGNLEFTFEGDQLMMDVRVFSTYIYKGTPKETEEMKPQWFLVDEVPFNDMWPDDRIWFPYMLKGKLFYGKFHYKGFDQIMHFNINELDSMEKFYADKK